MLLFLGKGSLDPSHGRVSGAKRIHQVLCQILERYKLPLSFILKGYITYHKRLGYFILALTLAMDLGFVFSTLHFVPFSTPPAPPRFIFTVYFNFR
jgi:hypothetical protein